MSRQSYATFDMIRSDLQSLCDEEIALTEVRTCGRQDARKQFYRGTEYVVLQPKSRIEMLVPAAGLADVIAVFSRGGDSGEGERSSEGKPNSIPAEAEHRRSVATLAF